MHSRKSGLRETNAPNISKNSQNRVIAYAAERGAVTLWI
jgi:hypothetical protein